MAAPVGHAAVERQGVEPGRAMTKSALPSPLKSPAARGRVAVGGLDAARRGHLDPIGRRGHAPPASAARENRRALVRGDQHVGEAVAG